MHIKISETKNIKLEEAIALYKANGWSAAKNLQNCTKPC